MRPPRSHDEQTSALARFVPLGRLWRAFRIETTISRKLLKGLAYEMVRIDDTIRLYESEMMPDETELFLDEWERAVGIPDAYGCLQGKGTVTQRRDAILIKLASLGVQTAEDFIELAELFGVTVTIKGGSYYALHLQANEPTIDFSGNSKEARHTIVVEYGIAEGNTFPIPFPIQFGSSGLSVLRCIFDRVRPATCDVYFRRRV